MLVPRLALLLAGLVGVGAGLGIGGRGWIGTGLTLLLITLLLPALSDAGGPPRRGRSLGRRGTHRRRARHRRAGHQRPGAVAPRQPRHCGPRPQPEGHRIMTNADAEGLGLENPRGDDTPARGDTPVARRLQAGRRAAPPLERPRCGRTAHRPPGGEAVRSAEEPKEPADGTAVPFRPGFLLVLGALVLAVLWAGGLFSAPDAVGRVAVDPLPDRGRRRDLRVGRRARVHGPRARSSPSSSSSPPSDRPSAAAAPRPDGRRARPGDLPPPADPRPDGRPPRPRGRRRPGARGPEGRARRPRAACS